MAETGFDEEQLRFDLINVTGKELRMWPSQAKSIGLKRWSFLVTKVVKSSVISL